MHLLIQLAAVTLTTVMVSGQQCPPVIVNTCSNDCSGTSSNLQTPRPRDCSDVYYISGYTADGIYEIQPENSPRPFSVNCIFDDLGEWIVVLRRTNGLTDFDRSWVEYRKGFGQLDSDFWLGLEKIHLITTQRQYTARIDLTDFEPGDNYAFAEYNFFQLGDEQSQYQLKCAHYNQASTAGDGLTDYHNGMNFSTFDRDNDLSDGNCAEEHRGGWFYNDCDRCNLNGVYHYDPVITDRVDKGIEWDAWKINYSFKTAQMRIRPTHRDTSP